MILNHTNANVIENFGIVCDCNIDNYCELEQINVDGDDGDGDSDSDGNGNVHDKN
jgi:hypothetical protein